MAQHDVEGVSGVVGSHIAREIGSIQAQGERQYG